MPIRKAKTASGARKAGPRKGTPAAAAAKPALLSGGNPQISKAEGAAPVRAYIAAMPGWKREIGRRLDGLITRTVPGVRKAVKWNSPLYGIEGQGWFLSLHCFAKYVKVAFFRGRSLRPLPPGESRQPELRYLDIHEDDQLDTGQLASWIRQAASRPGWDGGSRRSGGIPLMGEKMKQLDASQGQSAADLISQRIAELADWRGETLRRMRQLIRQADPDIVEEWKWMNPVWSHNGIICTGEAYQKVVKLTFARGASLKDPSHLFNSSLGGNVRRAIDIHQGVVVNASAFKALVREAVALSRTGKPMPRRKAKSRAAAS